MTRVTYLNKRGHKRVATITHDEDVDRYIELLEERKFKNIKKEKVENE